MVSRTWFATAAGEAHLFLELLLLFFEACERHYGGLIVDSEQDMILVVGAGDSRQSVTAVGCAKEPRAMVVWEKVQAHHEVSGPSESLSPHRRQHST
jgi:hypothetical protein